MFVLFESIQTLLRRGATPKLLRQGGYTGSSVRVGSHTPLSGGYTQTPPSGGYTHTPPSVYCVWLVSPGWDQVGDVDSLPFCYPHKRLWNITAD